MRYEQLLLDLGGALERGEVKPDEVERLLRRRPAAARPDLAGVLRALGVLVMFAGAGLLYGIQFASMGDAGQRTTPLIFPLAALATAVALHRARRPSWEVELAGVVGFVAYGLAVLTIGVVADAGSLYGMLAGIVATVLVIVMQRLLGIVRLTSWGLSASLVAFTGFAAELGGLIHGDVQWLFLAQAVVATAIGVALLPRSRDAAAGAWRAAALLAYGACIAGMETGSWSHLGPWHALLTLAVIATFTAAVLVDLTGLVWIGALGGLVWLLAVSDAVGASAGWALAVILLGAGLVGLALLVNRFGRRRMAPPGPSPL